MKKEHNVTVLFDAGWTALPWYVARHIFLAVERGESVPPEEVAPLQGHCSLLFASLLWRCWTTSKKPNCAMSVMSLEFIKNWSWIVTPYTVHIRTLYNSLHNEKASEASRVDWADWMCGSACFTWHWQFACKLSYLREKTLYTHICFSNHALYHTVLRYLIQSLPPWWGCPLSVILERLGIIFVVSGCAEFYAFGGDHEELGFSFRYPVVCRSLPPRIICSWM